MRVGQGWPGFLHKKYICQNHQTLPPFQDILPLRCHIFSIVVASYWWQQHKIFYPDCVANLKTLCLSSTPVWNFYPPRCTFIGPNKWRSLGLRQGSKKGDSWFPSSLLPMSPSDLAVECCHAVGWSLTVSQLFSSKLLGAYRCRASSFNIVH
jgi:hypothetical protein